MSNPVKRLFVHGFSNLYGERDFTASEAGVKLVGDITYIATWQGWVYLAVVLDCYSKKVIGWAMADHMRTQLVIDAMSMAMQMTYTEGTDSVISAASLV